MPRLLPGFVSDGETQHLEVSAVSHEAFGLIGKVAPVACGISASRERRGGSPRQ